ncbi:LRR receptor-like serine/threonine-protein kinase FLS2 [Phragmites australis]|uniref:LRR receptor-like serine/threonine-protein kinase FLS2 n=1 Tax=Phragmites australis TaxID=29695 RepID=UPI002D77F72A|nr:LRR receptor-like serine/threonine-protein kinase FLS2 [Phragmites australis]
MKHLHHHSLLLLSCIPLLLCAVVPVATGGRREAQALLKWKATLAGGRESLSSWSLAVNSTSPCNWMFVICNSAGDVIKLLISEASLNGTLAGLDFSAFPHLEVLDMESNDLYGSIPEGIGNLTSLTSLRIMYDPHLTGEIPRNIGKLKQLVELQLQSLGLNGAIPPEIGNLTSLEELSLGGNSLTGSIPPTIGNMTELHVMDLGQNHLDGELPSTLSHLVKLKSLSVSNNQLEGHITTQLGDKSNLVWIDISGNNFSGTFPQSICTGALQNFLARRNGFANLHLHDLNFQNCTSLEVLDFAANNILGDLGEIPSWIAESLPQLRFLRFSSNMFDGTIPKQVLQFRQLQLLDLSNNKLTGPIPVDFANFTGMTQGQEHVEITYYDNAYSDQIQLVWKNRNYVYNKTIRFIVGIDLSCNSISQMIPESLTTLRGLKYLNLSRNNLSGDIPKDIGNLALLESLDLSSNKLKGEIPPSFADLKSITTLNLSHNGLSGRIPTGRQLQTLDPSTYSNNPGLCGFPLKECADATSSQTEMSQDDDREALLLYCFGVAGFIFGFWLSWGIVFCNETWRCALYQYVDSMQEKVAKIAAYRCSRPRP